MIKKYLNLKKAWIIPFLFIPAAVFANPYYYLPFGRAKASPDVFFQVLFVPTILLEYLFLLIWFRPKHPWYFLLILIGAHIITSPTIRLTIRSTTVSDCIITVITILSIITPSPTQQAPDWNSITPPIMMLGTTPSTSAAFIITAIH